VADLQLKFFKKNPENKGKFMTCGLWRFSRHPNYFGEAVFWWGIFIVACSCEKGWITFYSPLIITLLLRYVSGVPLLEAEFKKRPGFEEYAKEVNCFIPWFPKKSATEGVNGDADTKLNLNKEDYEMAKSPSKSEKTNRE
jgi:steroid 5-alpha reductase family enzyme